MRALSVNLTEDQQIQVDIGTETRLGECYYLGLHHGGEPDCFQPVRGTVELFRTWLRLLLEIRDGQQVFLPFDFSDEYTRWLALQRTGSDVIAVMGWAAVEGWAISPGDFTELADSLPGFMPDEPLTPQTFYLPRLLSDLRSSLAVLSSRKDPSGRENKT